MLAFLCVQMSNRYKDGSGSSNGSGKEVSDSQADLENVGESVAGVVQALTELASVQTPASVWLPSKHLTVQLSGKVQHPLESCVMACSLVADAYCKHLTV